MKNFLLILLGAILLILGDRAYQAYQWKHWTDTRTFYAAAGGAYLFGPSGVETASGQSLSRQQLLDAILHDFVEHNPKLRFVK